MKDDIIILQSLLSEYKSKTITVDGFYKQVMKLQKDTSIIHYFKAKALKKAGSIDLAYKEIETAIKEWNCDCVESCIIALQANIGIKDFYYLAGELSAILGEMESSLRYYQAFQYYSCQLKSEFENFDSVVVYSFRRYSEYTLQDLINNEITVSHFSTMNDPFDCIANLWKDEERLKVKCKEKNHIKPFSDSFNYFRVRSFVANLSTMQVDDNIPKKILMWSHYADSHKGLCLRYRLSKNFIKENSKPDENGFKHMYLKKVDYSPTSITINRDSINTDLAFATKSIDWKYEDEIRLISYNSMQKDYHVGIPLDLDSKLEAVYFGYRTDDNNCKTIRHLLSNVSAYRIGIDNDNLYNLIIQPYGS